MAIVAEKDLPTEIRQLVDRLRREIRPILADRPVLLAYLYGILLYSRDEVRRVEFETLVRTTYFDYQPAEQMIRRAFLQHVKERGLRD